MKTAGIVRSILAGMSGRTGGVDARAGLLILAACLLVYNVNGRLIGAGDTIPSRYQPLAVVAHQTVRLDPIAAHVSQGREMPRDWQNAPPWSAYWMLPAGDGHIVSLYSVALPVLISPLYVPAAAYLQVAGWDTARVDRVVRIMEKLTASLIAALSAVLLYFVLRRRVAAPIALLLVIAYAFGTTTWVISSQALWQHGMGQLLIVGLLLVITAPSTARRAAAAGLLCGLIAANRPADAALVAPLGLYALWWAGHRAAIVFALAAAPILLVLLYNVTIVGAIGGGYQVVGRPRFFSHDMFEGLAGLLFSPTRGLFVFSPFLVFLALTAWHLPRAREERLLTLAAAAAVVLQVLLYSKVDWLGGVSWGPRFLTDLLPLLIWMLVPVIAAIGRRGRMVFAATVAVSVAIQSVGAFAYTGVSDLPIVAAAKGPDRLRAAWEWRNAPFVASLSHGLAPAELFVRMRGAIDWLEFDGRRTTTIPAGTNIVARGWALAGDGSPLQVGVSIDGAGVTAVRAFQERPDVREALGTTAPSGWSIPLETAHLAPGAHYVTLHVWASEKGDAYFLDRQTFVVEGTRDARTDADDAPDLAAAARVAAARIRAHQQAPGFWLTEFTGSPRFEQPQPEMNTYLTSLLVDLLAPMTPAFETNVARARRHLTEQIEPGGLVRYHGLPDAPGIGTLGCRITPDTDDTALAWRIAPAADRQRLTAALDVIEDYRAANGLYRTWLAPRDRYECLDPGADPNPTDFTIQMHLLQLLLEERPAAGRALCEALARQAGDDRVWVYYAIAPLVPMLRTKDLGEAGCALSLPADRRRTDVPGQAIWVSVVERLLRAGDPGGDPAAAAQMKALLSDLARDDFAHIRTNPPLLYHNDRSATVPRFYWSRDVGYALWLRLAREAAITVE